MPNAQKANLLRGKDLITIGIFSAIYFVLNFICMLISGLPLSKLHSARYPADGRIVIVASRDDEFMHLTCDCEIRLEKGENPYGRT